MRLANRTITTRWTATLAALFFTAMTLAALAQESAPPLLMPVGEGWAANSVNATVFRNDPITTYKDQQFVAFYNPDAQVVVAQRTIGQTEWKSTVTPLKGNVKDAHNVISLIADGAGYLHLSWDHHGNPLRYARSKTPAAADFPDKSPMTGANESNVTYPQFYQLADGNLIFLYRDGASGRGNLVINRYDANAQKWSQVHASLISGENKRNAYWQACVDGKGSLHVSWVWRESPDVASNHDLCYARSDDGGKTWKKSDGTVYQLPITAATAEVVSKIEPKHELINQTSMATDSDGKPIIATYFRKDDSKVPQYFVVFFDGNAWKTIQASERKEPFSLSGGGSKAIPISRPQVFARSDAGKTSVSVIFRDVERGTKVSVAHCPDMANPTWTTKDLTDFPVKFWEPSYDRVRWQRDGVLNLYVQMTGQGDAEKLDDVPPQKVYVLEWKP